MNTELTPKQLKNLGHQLSSSEFKTLRELRLDYVIDDVTKEAIEMMFNLGDSPYKLFNVITRAIVIHTKLNNGDPDDRIRFSNLGLSIIGEPYLWKTYVTENAIEPG